MHPPQKSTQRDCPYFLKEGKFINLIPQMLEVDKLGNRKSDRVSVVTVLGENSGRSLAMNGV